MFRPQKNRALEKAQSKQASILSQQKQEADRQAAARRRSIAAAQAGRQRGLLNALEGSGITRKLGGG